MIRLPDVPEQPDPYGWVVRMQALAELRALNDDPPQVQGLPDRPHPAQPPEAAPHRVGGSPDFDRERGLSTDPDTRRSTRSGPRRG